MALFILLFFFLFCLDNGVNSLQIQLKSNGPIVRGSNITFTAVVPDYTDEYLRYVFIDNAQPQHKEMYTNSTGVMEWSVNYSKKIYEAGEYTATVTLMKSFVGIWYFDNETSITFNITDSLSGDLILRQNNMDRPNKFVLINQTVTHHVKLADNELEFLKKNASKVVTYWFIDCNLVDQTDDYSLNYTYTDLMGDHYVEALVLADNEPLPPITTTTTTTTSTTTTTTTTTSTTTTTTPKPAPSTMVSTSSIAPSTNIVNSSAVHKLFKRSIMNKTKKVQDDISFVCYNTSVVPIGDNYYYGHFYQTLSVREPVSAMNITGSNWLQHGDLLRLQVKYAGSPPFEYCVQYKLGQYNVTGNETCSVKTKTMSNSFPLIHYFSDSDQHTVVVIVENEVMKNVSRATINIYKVTIHAQLSVIVVPVVFCLVAVILVVFGIAYYQHRSRYNIEVADFDFGQAHLDYKTFTERLRDSFRNAFNFRQEEDTDPLTSNARYDSMT